MTPGRNEGRVWFIRKKCTEMLQDGFKNVKIDAAMMVDNWYYFVSKTNILLNYSANFENILTLKTFYALASLLTLSCRLLLVLQ